MAMSLAILKTPTGRYTFVGSVPADLCVRRAANRSAIMGGRYVREGDELVEYRPLVADTEQECIDAAVSAGHTRFQLADCSWHD